MISFRHSFTVSASLAQVVSFHKDTRALKQLTPLPIFIQLHAFEPLAEGSRAEFTLWFGPIPVRWLAVHSAVDPKKGFTDTQQRGPLAYWQHHHQFNEISPNTTEVVDEITYQHKSGIAGAVSRLLFSPPALRLMFWYRSLATRAGVNRLK